MNTKYSNKYGNLIVPDLIGSVLNVPFDARKFNEENTVNQLCCTFKIKKLAKCYNTCMMTSILKLQHHSFVCPEASHKLIPVLITVYFELTTKPQA